jgi:hypothetical protein
MEQFFEDYLELLKELHDNLEQAIAGLPVEALDWVPGPDMNSLCVLIVHVTGATRFWIGDVIAGISSNRDRAAEFRARGLDEAALKQRLADTLAFVREVAATMTLAGLGDERTSANRPGQNLTVAWALLHALEHVGLHTGHAQITRQLWDQRRD